MKLDNLLLNRKSEQFICVKTLKIHAWKEVVKFFFDT